MTELGDLGEKITRQLGLRSILPRGKRQGPFDAELGHTGWVYEIKLLTTHAAEYKTKLRKADAQAKLQFAKRHGLTPATMMVIYSPEQQKAWCYWRVGIGSWYLTPGTAKEWTFAGALKV